MLSHLGEQRHSNMTKDIPNGINVEENSLNRLSQDIKLNNINVTAWKFQSFKVFWKTIKEIRSFIKNLTPAL